MEAKLPYLKNVRPNTGCCSSHEERPLVKPNLEVRHHKCQSKSQTLTMTKPLSGHSFSRALSSSLHFSTSLLWSLSGSFRNGKKRPLIMTICNGRDLQWNAWWSLTSPESQSHPAVTGSLPSSSFFVRRCAKSAEKEEKASELLTNLICCLWGRQWWWLLTFTWVDRDLNVSHQDVSHH